jgi:hypothetical protein
MQSIKISSNIMKCNNKISPSFRREIRQALKKYRFDQPRQLLLMGMYFRGCQAQFHIILVYLVELVLKMMLSRWKMLRN